MQIAYLCLESTREGSAPHAHVHEIVAGLRRREHDVSIFEPVGGSGRKANLLAKMWSYVTIQTRLMQEASTVDIVYVRAHPAAILVLLWSRLLRKPVLQEINGPYDDLFDAHPWTRRLRFLIQPMMRAVLRTADAVVVGTEQLGGWINREIGNLPQYLIPNGANVDLFRPDAILSYDLPQSYVVFFGSLAPWQGLDSVLKALDDPAWPSTLSLVIAGDGAMRQTVEDVASRDPRVVYLGGVPYHQVPGIVANSLGGLSAKNYPSGLKAGLSPLKVYETLACGVPVVVTDLPGQVDVVRRHRCGLIVEMQRPDQIASAVRYLYECEAERKEMGQIGREVVVTSHSWDRRAGDTELALKQVIDKYAVGAA